MPDDNRTQVPGNDTPHDPLDDLIAPILGRDVTRETRRTTTHIATTNLGQPDPLDDLLSDDELLADSHKVTVVSDSRSKRHILRTAPVSVLLLVALLLVVTGVWGGGRFANRSEEAAPLADGVALRQVQGTTFEQTPQDANDSHEPVVSPSQLKRISEIQPFFQYDPDGSDAPVIHRHAMRLEPPPLPQQRENLESAQNKPEQEGKLLQAPRDASNKIVAQVEPSVVSIQRPNGQVIGSGFILDSDRGIVVTNRHVVVGQHELVVMFHDGQTETVLGFLGVSQDNDLATLKVSGQVDRYPQLELTDRLPSKGDDVLALGSPLGLTGSVTKGIVSSIRKASEFGHAGVAQWIQHSASISPGNSGGPLVDGEGKVVGVNTIFYKAEVGQNINFAVAFPHIRDVARNGSDLPKPLVDLVREAKQTLERIRANAQSGKFAVAEAELGRLPDSFQLLPDYWILKGEFAETREQWTAAIALFQKALSLDDGDSQVWYRIGRANQILGTIHALPSRYELAIEAFSAGIRKKPNDDDCWRGLGKALQSTKRWAEAERAFRRSLKLNPNRALTFTELGDVLESRGDVDGGLAEYKTALNMEKNLDVVHFNYGRFLQRIGRCRDAIGAFETSRDLTKDPVLKGRIELELRKSRRLLDVPQSVR